MDELHDLELDVRGMHCPSCEVHVREALESVPGVKKVRVPDWRSARAEVTAEETMDPAALTDAVQAAGYSARVRSRKPVEGAGPNLGRNDVSFDLLVIGGGSAGFAAAIKGAELGARVALVEDSTLGGTCVNIGCIPSKTLLRAVERYHLAGDQRFRGIDTRRGSLSWSETIDHKDELVNELRQTKYVDVLKAFPNIALLSGRARLTPEGKVEVDGVPYAASKIVIATGARPWAPPIPGLAEAGHLDSQAALDLRQVPESLIVLGGNAVGLELAQLYARAGSQVTVAELEDRVAPFEDEEVSAALAGYLREEGIRIVTGFSTAEVVVREGRYLLHGTRGTQPTTLEAERLLVATGRRANTEGLGLDAAGVQVGQRGEVLVDEHLRTTNPAVYAAGDVLGEAMFVYVAAYGGGLAAENALLQAGRVYDTESIPRVTFTDPQIASAGLTEGEARRRGYTVQATTLSMEHVPRAQAARDRRGLIKLVVDSQTDRLLGAHILAPEAGEIIQMAVLAMRFNITVDQLRATMFPYLTNAESLRLAALSLEKDIALLSCCAA